MLICTNRPSNHHRITEVLRVEFLVQGHNDHLDGVGFETTTPWLIVKTCFIFWATVDLVATNYLFCSYKQLIGKLNEYNPVITLNTYKESYSSFFFITEQSGGALQVSYKL